MIDRIGEVYKELMTTYNLSNKTEAYKMATEIVKIEMLDRRLKDIDSSLDRIYKEV